MHCAKIGGECPHLVRPDSNYIFVLMPFKNSKSIFDCIKQAAESLENKEFVCERADVKYTSLDIWCHKICRSIRRAKYLIADTTGMNANVFYELGFAHALGHTKNIILTQAVEELPFDISGYSAIHYTEKDFPKLRNDLQKALIDLEAQSAPQVEKNQTPEEIIQELKAQLRKEEERANTFKKELRKSEAMEMELKKRIAELNAIEENPVVETEKLIAEKEQEIKKLQGEMDLIDMRKREEVGLIRKRLDEERLSRQNLKQELEKFKQTGDEKKFFQTIFQIKNFWKTRLLDQAIELEKNGKFEKAITLLDQIIKRKPNYQNAYLHRSNCLRKLKNFEGAVSDLNKAIELNPKSALYYASRGYLFANKRNFKRALVDYNKAIELDPKNSTFYKNRGRAFYNIENYKQAIADSSKAIELDPKSAYAYNICGISYKRLNNFELAIENFNKAIGLNVKNSNAYYNRGIIFCHLKDFKRAVTDCKKAIDLNPKNIGVRLNSTEVFLIAGEIVEAEECARKSIELSQEIKDKIIGNYLYAISLKLQGKSTKNTDAILKQLCDKNPELSWSFKEIEDWLEDADISTDCQNYIVKITKMLKKHELRK